MPLIFSIKHQYAIEILVHSNRGLKGALELSIKVTNFNVVVHQEKSFKRIFRTINGLFEASVRQEDSSYIKSEHWGFKVELTLQ